VLEDWQTDTLKDIKQWIMDFSHVQSPNSRWIIYTISQHSVGYLRATEGPHL
jgi:hypothetical protein